MEDEPKIKAMSRTNESGKNLSRDQTSVEPEDQETEQSLQYPEEHDIFFCQFSVVRRLISFK